MTTKQQRRDAMVDVRRAYRLVWAHQRRMLDMVEAIVAAFPETAHYYWTTIGCAGLPSRKTTNPLGRWAWDALPYYDVSWMRLEDGEDEAHKPRPGRWMLEIRHEADDGWETGEGDAEPDARLFGPAEKASSTLHIVLWKSEEETAPTWYDAWDHYAEGWPDAKTDPSQTDPESGLRAIIVSRDLVDLASIEDIAAMANAARQKGRELLGLDLPDLTTPDN